MPELQMEKISFGIVGKRGESVLQLCAEKPLQIVIRIGQGLQRTIPQMQLHGGILHSHIDFAFAKRLPIVVRRKKIICLPAEHRRQYSGGYRRRGHDLQHPDRRRNARAADHVCDGFCQYACDTTKIKKKGSVKKKGF